MRLAAALALAAVCPTGAIDSTAPLVRRWTVSEGLPQMSVNEVLQGGDRLLWLATFGGLASFDGTTFEVHDLASLPGLPSNRIVSLASEPAGGLWVFTEEGAVVRFDGTRVLEAVAPAGPHLEVLGGARDGSGGLWVRERPGGILRWDGHTWRRVADNSPDETWEETAPREGGAVEDLESSAEGEIWARERSRLLRFSPNGQPLGSYPASAPIIGLAKPAGGRLWLGTADGLARLADGRISMVAVDPPIDGPVGLVLGNPDEPPVLATSRELIALEADPGGAERPFRRAWSLSLAEGTNLRDLYRDDEGNIWAGTDGAGLLRISTSRLIRPTGPSARRPVVALVSDGAGGALVAPSCEGLIQVTPDGRRATPFATPLPVSRPRDLCVDALLRDSHGSLWVGARGRILRAATLGAPLGPTGVVFGSEGTGPLVETPQGVWASSREGKLIRFDLQGKIHEQLDLETPISALATGPDGTLWVGSRGAVYRVRKGLGEPLAGDSDLRGADVRDLAFTANGTWLATYGRGLGLWDGHQVRWITTANGLPDNSLSRLLVDSRRRVWILSNAGLGFAPLKDLEDAAAGRLDWVDFVLFGADDGMPEGNHGAPAGFADRTAFWFGTIEGPVRVAVHSFPARLSTPKVTLRRALVGERQIAAGGALQVPAGAGRLELQFASPSFTAPSRVRLRYRLQGIEDGWTETRTRTAVYTHLPAGPQRLEVVARNEDGVWSQTPLVVDLEVSPSWWQHRWLQGLGLALLAGLGLTAHQIVVRGVEHRTRRLLVEVEARREAEKEAQDLRLRLEHLDRTAAAGELAAALAHEVRQPLSAIANAAGAAQLKLRLGEEGKVAAQELLTEVIEQSMRASEVVQGIRRFLSRSEPSSDVVDLNLAAREVLPLVRRELATRRVEARLELSSKLPPAFSDQVQIQQVLVNLLLNACQALVDSPPPRWITITTFAESGRVCLRVADNGPGVAPDVRDRLFRSFVTTKPFSMGVGLSICRTILSRHGGKIELEPSPSGASFLISLQQADADGAKGRREKAVR